MLSACSGSPEGLSFSRMSVPVAVVGVAKTRVAWNGTNSVVIHSPCACAGVMAISTPLPSRSRTGKLASKYHGPRASPVTVSGLVTTAFGVGVVREICECVLLALEEAIEDKEDEADEVPDRSPPEPHAVRTSREAPMRRVECFIKYNDRLLQQFCQ